MARARRGHGIRVASVFPMTSSRSADAPGLALFDFDGTLTVRETFADFMRAAVSPVRRLAGIPLFAPMLAGYKVGWVSGTTIRSAVVRFGFRGVPEARVRRAGETFARDVIPGLVDADMMRRLEAHRARGDTVLVVSGALDAYLAPWCRQQGLPLLCSRLEAVDGVLTGGYRGAQCVGDEKARRVRENHDLAAFGQISAYGDTAEDHALLALADRPFFRGQPMARDNS
jgi:phosphatidylglycerophosphatase C